MRFLTYAFCLLITWNFLGCKFGSDNKSNQSKDTLTVNSFEFKKGAELDRSEWSCNVANEDIICHPSKWTPVKQSKLHYFAYLDSADKTRFFTVLTYNVAKDKIDAKGYLKEVYAQASKDTVERFDGFTVKELIFSDRNAYYAEYYTTIDNEPFLTYSMVFENSGTLYDVALKLKKSEASSYKQVFTNILYNVRANNSLVFDENDKLEKIAVVDISRL